jgi:hypothetical protein
VKQSHEEVAEVVDESRDDVEGTYEMANLYPEDTGLPFVVWISTKTGVPHDVRVKVSLGPKMRPSEMTSVAIRPTVRVVKGEISGANLALLTKWINLNREVIMKYWEGDISTKNAIAAVRPMSARPHREHPPEGIDDSDGTYEMANLFPKRTGLPFVVWISTKAGCRHDVRVKVSPGPNVLPSEMASVAIRPSIRVVSGDIRTRDLALLENWINLNRDVLLRYWEGELDTGDAIEAILPIS